MTTDRRLDRLYGEIGELLARHEATGRSLEEYAPFADDPVGFLTDPLDWTPTDYQAGIARALMEHPLVTVRSCHAAGKDALAARLALWWCYSRRGLVVLTGPTAAQVEEILMRGEIREAFRGSGLPGDLHVKALRPGGEGRAGIIAKTGSGVSSLTGFHDARVLFVITEAQDPEIAHAWDAAFACTTGAEDRVLTLGNPTTPDGRFYRAHQPGSDWHAVKIAADDIPNVRRGKTVVPGLLTKAGVKRFASEYGTDSSVYTSRVQAEFPDTATDALVKREWIEAAVERHESGELDGVASNHRVVVGVDPARLGPDRTVLCARRGPVVLGFETWQGLDTMATARRVYGEVARLLEAPSDHTNDGVETVYVDEVGLGGGVLDRLKETLGKLVYEYRVTLPGTRWTTRTTSPQAEGVTAGSQAERPGRFRNLKAQMYWRLRRELEDGNLALPDDPDLWEELMKTRVRFGPDGRTEIEPKSDLKSRLGRSPDKADALMLTMRPMLEDDRPEAWVL